MRPIEWNTVPESGQLVLLTMHEPKDGVPASMADFRDSSALCHRETGRWIGLSRSRGIRFGHGEPELRDGIWYVEEDERLARSTRDVLVSAADMELRLLP